MHISQFFPLAIYEWINLIKENNVKTNNTFLEITLKYNILTYSIHKFLHLFDLGYQKLDNLVQGQSIELFLLSRYLRLKIFSVDFFSVNDFL